MSTTVQAKRVVEPWPLARRAVSGLAQPGGRVMLERALDAVGADDGDRVVELAPGLGLTTDALLARDPREWTGVEPDPLAAGRLAKELGGAGRVVAEAPVDATGLPDESATLVVSDALLSTLDAAGRAAVLAEARRLLRPGGRLLLHELIPAPGLSSDPDAAEALEAIGIAPPPEEGWREAVEGAGLVVVGSLVGPLAMPPQRDLMRRAGPRTALRITRGLATDHAMRALATRSRQTLERRALSLRSVVVVAEMPLILGMRRPRR